MKSRKRNKPMGKAAKNKLIRRMAAKMPALNKGIRQANHTTEMKRLYNKHGAIGLMAYAKAVENEEKKINDSKAISVPVHNPAG